MKIVSAAVELGETVTVQADDCYAEDDFTGSKRLVDCHTGLS